MSESIELGFSKLGVRSYSSSFIGITGFFSWDFSLWDSFFFLNSLFLSFVSMGEFPGSEHSVIISSISSSGFADSPGLVNFPDSADSPGSEDFPGFIDSLGSEYSPVL